MFMIEYKQRKYQGDHYHKNNMTTKVCYVLDNNVKRLKEC